MRFKQVLALSAGRAGSKTFANACSYITNYTSGHETRLAMPAAEKINYPDFHIESDNRLSWMLGLLNERLSDSVFYVYLYRDEEKIARSYNRRWAVKNGIMPAYAQGVLMMPTSRNDIVTCRDYVSCVHANIKMFLKDKQYVVIDIDNPQEGFECFWEKISAQGDKKKALQAFEQADNTSSKMNLYRRLRYKAHLLLDKAERTIRS
ncbi:hypothetical protein [Alcanivorax quisquiliarum]|uniref:Sulfotransferase family protein n=1 Tax=Alcanivorax quisquiliarum TaxID=2933565 RepID=A0ABT0E2Q9_9GAMM|nr:hypothetical protein [Alcanivorax quisquiliarum]MCK0536100.1 hypothetical protein [Alcanivorax quisquiliarum]